MAKSKPSPAKPPTPRRPVPAPGGYPRAARPGEGTRLSAHRVFEFLTVPRILVIFAVLDVVVVAAFVLFGHRILKTYTALAYDALAQNEWARAAKFLKVVRKAQPASALLNAQLGHSLVSDGKSSEALQYLDIALDKQEQLRGNARYLSDLYAARARALLDIAAREKDEAAAHKTLDEAAQSARKALEYDSTHALANEAMGAYYVRKGDLKAAGPYYLRLASMPEYDAVLRDYRRRLDESLFRVDESLLEDVPEQVAPTDQPATAPLTPKPSGQPAE